MSVTLCSDPADALSASGPCVHPADAAPASPRWVAIASIALGVFGLVTAEFLPASLLTGMAADLGVSVGTAGQAVTATAVVGAIAAPTVPMLTRRLDRRHVMLALTVLLVASNLLAVLAGSFAMLLVARLMLGVALGGFWSMSGALALRLAPADRFARAMAVILTGVSVATVCSAPVGAWMGNTWGWRSAFVAAGAVSVVTLAVQWFSLPSMPPRGPAGLQVLGMLLRRSDVRIVLFAVLLVISGHFAGFTYMRALMEEVAHLPPAAVSAVLLAFGVGGFFGNLVGGAIAQRSERWAVVAGGGLITVLALALVVAGTSSWVTAVALTAWGFAFAAFPVGFQTWIVRVAPDHAESAGGLLVAAFQVAIASGALAGGLLVDRMGALGGPWVALFAVGLGTALTFRHGRRPAA